MNALQQYIDLYRGHSDIIIKNAPEVLNKPRNEAFKRLENSSLPAKGSENFETTDLQSILAPDFGLNIARVPLEVNPAASFHCGVPNLSTSLFLLLNDSWAETQISRRSIPDGVIIDSLAKAARNYPELVSKYYGKIADSQNPLVNLNTAFAQDGLFLYIPDGTVLERPIQLVNILANGAPLMAIRRLLIIVGENAEAKLLLCDHTQNPDVNFLSLQTIEIFAEKGAHFDLYDLEESSEKTARLSSLYLSQKENSNVLIDGITLFNGITRNEYFCSFAGTDAELQLLGMAIEDKNRHTDTCSMIRHDFPRCHSKELFKYVVDDEATGAFTGRIYVADGATETEAYQSNRNLVGSDKARMYSKPQLEIYNDDVKCSHGTAIGQLDPTQLFYMRTRGLSEDTAKMLLKQAFMADVIDGVRLPVLRDRLRLLVERRFNGAQSLCGDCLDDCELNDNTPQK